MGVSDIFNEELIGQGMITATSIGATILALTISFILTMFIYQIYRLTFTGVVYNKNFSITLVLIALTTTTIIMAVSSNVILSLGMVGALSIVRFRAAIKDPKDIAYLFWAITVGIASGAGIYGVAISSSLFIGLVMIVMAKQKIVYDNYLLVIKYENEVKDVVWDELSQFKYKIKSKIVSNKKTELSIEINKLPVNTGFVERISDFDGVESVVLIKYNGEYAE